VNRIRTIFRRIFPPPRRSLDYRAWIPLAAFAVLFALVCFSVVPTPRMYLSDTPFNLFGLGELSIPGIGALSSPHVELIRNLDFDYPWMFCLLIFAPWIWWMQVAGHSGLAPVRSAIAVFIRLGIAGLLILVLAGPRSVKTSDIISVVYSVDVSDSVNEARQTALDAVASSAAGKPAHDQAGLVIFGRTAAVELPPRESFPFEKFLNAQVGRDATNLEQSLALSAAMLPEEHRGRIVLFSDGTETVGQLKDIVDDLQARDVQVDVVPIEYAYEHEVLLERLDLPRHVRLGETYEASVVLTSMASGKGTLVLEQNEEELTRLPVQFDAGRNRFAIPIHVESPGYYEYTARIEVPAAEDNRSENNIARNYLFIDGPGRVLLVTDAQDDPQEWAYFQEALKHGNRQVEVIDALEFPLDPLSLMPYDAVVFADVPADMLMASQIQAMHDSVRDLGIGFLMLGGPNSFGPGGYQNSPIEDCLPISMEISKKKILPRGALVIILHTCEFPQGNTWAKRITKQAIKVLNAEDDVGAIGYGMNGDHWIFELTPAGDYDKLVPQINKADIGDMPSFISSMKMGLKALKESDAASRHMIIISDGDANPPSPAGLQEFVDEEITVSTVAVFPHGPQGTKFLQGISSVTGGRFYFPSDPRQLPSIFIKEAKTLRRKQVQERTFVPELITDDAIVRGFDGLPELHGYVLTSEKEDPRAKIILAAPPKEDDPVASDSDVDPILAVWRYGLGATAAFTSDMTTDWGKDWVAWDQFQQIVNQLMTRISRVRKEQYLRVYTYTNGNEGVIVVEDFHPEESLLDVKVSVNGPNNFSKSTVVRQIAPRRYQVSIPLQGQGRYQIQVGANGADRKETAFAGFIVAYSPEYLRFRANPIVLRDVAERTGGREIDVSQEPEQLTAQIFGDRQPKRSTSRIFDWFLMALACMIPMDVAIRRVQLDFSWLRKLFAKEERKEATATMGALLQKSQAVRTAMDSNQPSPTSTTERLKSQRRGPLPTAPATKKQTPDTSKSTPAPQDKKPPSTSDGGTTSRLLAMKRKREEEKEE
jgi:uncharacterized membrane protein